jgi:hypothetical protein
MTSRRPSQRDVLAALQHLCAEQHFGYAPGRASAEGVLNAIAIGGFGRGAPVRAAVREHLEALVAAGLARKVDVISPAGKPIDGWFEPV